MLTTTSTTPTTAAALIVALAVAAGAAHAGDVYQLRKEDCVRFDVPGLAVQPNLDLIVDDPPAVDKRTLRTLQSTQYVPDEVYVRFKPGVSRTRQLGSHALAGVVEVLWESMIVPDLYRVRTLGLDVPATIDAYLDQDDVLYAEPHYLTEMLAAPNDPEWSELWGLHAAGFGSRAELGWEETVGSQDVIVAVIDSGVDYFHFDLLQNMWTNPGEIAGNGIDDDGNGYVDDFLGWTFVDGGHPDPYDGVAECHGHGTHVAGTIGARGNNGLGIAGVNWNCRIMPLRVGYAYGPDCSMAYTADAMDYAITNGARVSNLSFGGPTFFFSVHDTILAGQAFDHVFVAAAGNDGSDNDANPFYPASYRLSNIIAVAALDQDGTPAGFTNYGEVTVDLAAPGVSILSTLPANQFGTYHGTSMAAPHVAGAVALVMSRFPELTWPDARARVLNGATFTPSLNGLVATGGRLDVWTTLGIWVNPWWVLPGVGTRTQPFRAIDVNLAILLAPDGAVVNFEAGAIPLANFTTTTIDQPQILRADEGTVVLGTVP